MERQRWLLVFILTCTFSVFSYAQQGITGIWKGYFITDNGEHYKLEFQVKQGQTFSVNGVSYSYLDIRFYGKATMTGSYIKSTKNFRIKEIRTVEVKSTTGGGTCIMNYDLTYTVSGKEEFLEGTYLGKPEVKGRENPYAWGDCGGGKVYLRKVVESDFYIEPFLRPKNNTTNRPAVKSDAPSTRPSKDSTVKKTNPPVVTRKPPVTNKTTTPVKRETTATTKPKADTISKKDLSPVVKAPVKAPVMTPNILKERQNELMKSLVVHHPSVTVKLYDNGEIDDDTISIFYDKKLMLSGKRLSTTPITLTLDIDDEDTDHELIMVADNLGRIPPNTSLMIVEAGDQRFDVRITSTAQKNALVRFRYQKP